MKKERFVAGVFGSLLDKKIRFNPHPHSNPKPVSCEEFQVVEERFVDRHAEIAQMVDALIVANERELNTEELEFPPEERVDLNPQSVLLNLEDNH